MGRPRDKRRPNRPNATGRNDTAARFVMLPHRILNSAAYASLDLTARAVLQELMMIYNGANNGSLWLSVRDATDRLGLGDYAAAMRALGDIQDRGFAVIAKDAHFDIKASETSRARCWRLTWHAWPECPDRKKRAPTNDWEVYAPPGGTRASKRADKRLRALDRFRKRSAAGHFPVGESLTMEPIMPTKRPRPVGESLTASPESDAIPPFLVVRDSLAHIHPTMGRGALGWWSTDNERQLWAQILLLFIVAQNRPLELARAA